MPHAAPEVLLGSASSIASDIWAVGCALYRVLAGNYAFVSRAATPLAGMKRSSG